MPVIPETYQIKGVEIFSAGTWNGDEYTQSDLEEIVRAFNENLVGSPPPLKLGHDGKQKMLQEDGMPAAGWVQRLYIVGEKLVADFSDIPKKIYELIQAKAYRKVSCELFWNIKVGEKAYSRMLAAVALLGADSPGVMNLKDIMSLYKKFEGQYDKLAIDNQLEFEIKTTKEGANMPEVKTEKEVKLEYDLKHKEDALKEATEKLEQSAKEQAAKDTELADLKKFKAEADIKEQKLLVEKEATRIENFVTALCTEKLCTPAMKPLMIEILGADKKEYSAKIGDKETKFSKDELIKEALKLFKAAAEVNFEESSTTGNTSTQNDSEVETDKAAKEYAAKNNVSYGSAVKAILKQFKKK